MAVGGARPACLLPRWVRVAFVAVRTFRECSLPLQWQTDPANTWKSKHRANHSFLQRECSFFFTAKTGHFTILPLLSATSRRTFGGIKYMSSITVRYPEGSSRQLRERSESVTLTHLKSHRQQPLVSLSVDGHPTLILTTLSRSSGSIFPSLKIK